MFMNAKIFDHVLILLSIYRFKPKARKFIFNLFEDIIFNDQISDDTTFSFWIKISTLIILKMSIKIIDDVALNFIKSKFKILLNH
jgi:hypothetical protein